VLDKKSEVFLRDVDPVLASVIARSIEIWNDNDFLNVGRMAKVVSGFRTADEQLKLYHAGKTRTTKSAHMAGLGVDIALINGKLYETNFRYYENFNRLVQRVSVEFDAIIGWGGDWLSLRDGPHFYIVDREPFLTVPLALAEVATSPAKDRGAL